MQWRAGRQSIMTEIWSQDGGFSPLYGCFVLTIDVHLGHVEESRYHNMRKRHALSNVAGALLLRASSAAWIVAPHIAPHSLGVRVVPSQRQANSLLKSHSIVEQAGSMAGVNTASQRKDRRLLLLPPFVVSERVFAVDNRPIILFDGVCNLCNNAVNLALDWDLRGELRFAALQSDVGRSLLEKNGKRADDISTIVLVTAQGAYIKSDAVLKITEALSPTFVPTWAFAKLAQVLIPKILRDVIYDQVADNRYRLMGKRDVCRLGDVGQFEDRFVKDDFAHV
jgi:predicted DCC family thiol-disulfide oxidoreductase YuxK